MIEKTHVVSKTLLNTQYSSYLASRQKATVLKTNN